LGGKVNATIRDRYMGAASATPASIFPLLLRNAQNHLGKLRKDGKGHWLERDLEEIQDKIEDDQFPKSLKLEQQGKFFLGYYHQRRAQFAHGKEAGETNDQNEEGSQDGE
jgi:CRISPR-associated protein Csd1